MKFFGFRIRTEHRVDLVDFPDHGSDSQSYMRLPNQGRPTFGGETAEILLDDSKRRRRKARLPDLSPVRVRVHAIVPDSDLTFIGDMGRDSSDELQIVHHLRLLPLAVTAPAIPDLALGFLGLVFR